MINCDMTLSSRTFILRKNTDNKRFSEEKQKFFMVQPLRWGGGVKKQARNPGKKLRMRTLILNFCLHNRHIEGVEIGIY